MARADGAANDGDRGQRANRVSQSKPFSPQFLFTMTGSLGADMIAPSALFHSSIQDPSNKDETHRGDH